MINRLLLSAFLCSAFLTYGQQLHKQSWFSAASQTRLTRHSGIWIDANLKFDGEFYKRTWSSLIRIAYLCYINDNARAAAGYGHIVTYGNPNIPEERLWEQFYWQRRTPSFRYTQYIRIEERFKRLASEGSLVDHYDYKTTLRYNLQFTSKVLGKAATGVFVYAGNELFLNVSKRLSNDFFDQDRIGGGLGYRFSEQLAAQLGYLYSHQRLTNNRGNVNINVLRLAFYHTLDLRRKA